jgi:hypothetical protein
MTAHGVTGGDDAEESHGLMSSSVQGFHLRKVLFVGILFARAALPGNVLGQYPEYVLKAEFIERFTHFVDWPDSAFASPDAPFVLCLIGENPFGDYLNRLAREGTVKGRPIVFSHAKAIDQLDPCHLVFVARDEKDRVAAIVARTGGKPILTIGDTSGFAQTGIIINFYQLEDRVRFEINVDEAKRSDLKFNSQLMKLARIVGTGK